MGNLTGGENLLDVFNDELAKIRDTDVHFSKTPENKIRTEDHVAGVLTHHLCKIRCLYLKNALQLEEAMPAAEILPFEERSVKQIEINQLLVLLKVTYEIFWDSCYYTFPLLVGKKNIGIREGWEIVWADQQSDFDLTMS
jgi:hypothetical protein